MQLHGKKIGIWGYGITGKSITNFLRSHNVHLTILEKRDFDKQELSFFQDNAIEYGNQTQGLENFFADNDMIYASAGIDIRPYNAIYHKLITELDLFSLYFKKPIIAVTGSVGKTTVTTLLAQALEQQGLRIACGGNIGIGVCDFIAQQESYDYAVLEVSSFQLEHCKYFAPDLAIWTNFYPNHLDRHTTIDDYFQAKYMIMQHQKEGQQALIPFYLAHKLPSSSQRIALHAATITEVQREHLCQRHQFPLFYQDGDSICKKEQPATTMLTSRTSMPTSIIKENMLIVQAALSLLKKQAEHVVPHTIEHRMELISIINGVRFYNDSKATIMQSTIAATTMLAPQGKILLFLGGLSKGVDRQPYIQQLHGNVIHVFCFGSESTPLAQMCRRFAHYATEHRTLEDAFALCVQKMKPHDIVLFSPGGSSFDLFEDYQERGQKFKELVQQAAAKMAT